MVEEAETDEVGETDKLQDGEGFADHDEIFRCISPDYWS